MPRDGAAAEDDGEDWGGRRVLAAGETAEDGGDECGAASDDGRARPSPRPQQLAARRTPRRRPAATLVREVLTVAQRTVAHQAYRAEAWYHGVDCGV